MPKKKSRAARRPQAAALEPRSAERRSAARKAVGPHSGRAAARPSAYDLSDADVERALLSRDGSQQRQLEELFGEAALTHLRTLAQEGERTSLRHGPSALLLPGIMGSKLGFERTLIDDTIWLDPIDIALGNLMLLSPQRGKKVKALGVLLTAYLELKLKLRLRGIDASFYPYDWRLDIRQLGADLARHIEQDHSSKGVYLVCHSMGGLVARRAMHILRGAGKVDLVRRVIMLGTPNHGAFSPAIVLRKCHDLTRKLAQLDQQNSLDELIENLFSRLVGLIQLLPPTERGLEVDLLDPAAWPPGARPHVVAAKAAQKLTQDLDQGDERYVMIAGYDRPTFVGARIQDGEFVFRRSKEGDGTVPLAHAELAGVPTLYTRAEHGGMPNNNDVICAVADLILRGRTEALPSALPDFDRSTEDKKESELRTRSVVGKVRGVDTLAPTELRDLLSGFVSPSQPASATAASAAEVGALAWQNLSAEPVEISRRRQRSLDLRIALGDISQVDARAIVLGIFEGVEPTGAAKALDRHLEGTIRDLVENGLLRGAVGQIFVLPTSRQSIRAEFIMFVGLGRVEAFDDARVRSVARTTALALARSKLDDFATVLLGGGTGSNPAASLANMVSGFLESLRESDRAEHVRRVTIVENNRARHEQAVEQLRMMATSTIFDDVRVTLSRHELPPPAMAPVGWRGDAVFPPDPVYLSVREEVEYNAGKPQQVLHMTLLTADKGATALVDAQEVDFTALDNLLSKLGATPSAKSLGQLGDWLADKVLPTKLREALAQSLDRHLVVMHDESCARVPWEALRLGGSKRPALMQGMSRKLLSASQSAMQWLSTRPMHEQLRVLLVVNPTLNLAGAKQEGEQLAQLLRTLPRIKVTSVSGKEATRARIREELATGQYDVLHYAGHAYFDAESPAQSGLLCADGLTFAGAQLAGIEALPFLAVINACESGRVRNAAAPKSKLADSIRAVNVKVSLAEAFLTGGIASYVGTYWPVGDQPASTFAKVFYTNLLEGAAIATALVEARKKVEEAPSIDWADYIHYGTRTLKLRAPH